jgi:hypothetical protein
MSTLVINDLLIGKELDREAMASIIGGGCGHHRDRHGRRGRRKGGYYKRVDQNVDIDIDIVGNNNTVIVDVDQRA